MCDHYRTIFSAVHDVHLEKAALIDTETDMQDEGDYFMSRDGRRSTQSLEMRTPMLGANSPQPPKIDKRLAQIHVSCTFRIFTFPYAIHQV